MQKYGVLDLSILTEHLCSLESTKISYKTKIKDTNEFIALNSEPQSYYVYRLCILENRDAAAVTFIGIILFKCHVGRRLQVPY